MKRLGLAPCVGALLLTALTGNAAGRFDQKLTLDKKIVHVLNRLTFGLRPGDVAEVRRVGVEKWIDLQLHPERIAENPDLLARLKPLETLQLATWQINEKYAPPQRQAQRPIQSLLTPLQLSKLRDGGSAEERRQVINSLTPDVRRLVLAAAPPQALEGLPDLQQEAMRTGTFDVQRPPQLNDLLSPEQQRMLRSGTPDEKLALVGAFDEAKRKQVIRAVGPQGFLGVAQLRREALAMNQPQQYVNQELIENKLYRAIYSNRQLEEVLVDFWMNHFNVFNGKNQTRVLLTSYERDAIRPHVLGHFRELLSATAHHPAMLIYLDNFQSQVPREDVPQTGPNGAPARRPGINENYGRELMELHTLGVDGGYTQDDVIAVARAFTGWTVYDPQKYAEFQFNPAGHDRKEKVVLGRTLPAGRGEQDGMDVIDILARHPSTAKFISKKLAQRFVADDPPQALIDRMAATFTKTGGDLRAVLATLFTSIEFSSEGAWQSKLKSPLEMVVSAVRALNADAADVFPLAQRIAEIGQPLYAKVEPTGYPNTSEQWTSASGILGRINFATALTSGQVPGVRIDVSRFNFKLPAVVAGELLGIAPSPETLTAIDKSIQGREATPSMLAATIVGSPEFQKR
jgi:uncharacterized protein (DUF1800 family)